MHLNENQNFDVLPNAVLRNACVKYKSLCWNFVYQRGTEKKSTLPQQYFFVRTQTSLALCGSVVIKKNVF